MDRSEKLKENLRKLSLLNKIQEEADLIDLLLVRSPEPCALYNKEGHIIFHNNAYEELFQSVPPEGYSIFSDPIAQKEHNVDEVISALKNNQIVVLPEMWYNPHKIDDEKPDHNICIKIIVFPILNHQKMLQYILMKYDDVTEKKRALQNLEKEKNAFKNIIDMNPYAIQIFDKDGYHVGENQAFIDLYHTVPPEGYNFFEDPIHQKLKNTENLRQILDGKLNKRQENWYNPHDLDPRLPDKLVCHNTVGFPIFNMNNEVEKAIIMYEDITDRKMAEKELKELKNQLEHRVTQRTLLLEKSEKKFRQAYKRANCYKGLFTHDVSNIFQVVSNAIEFLDEKGYNNYNSEVSEIMESLKKNIMRGKKLIYNIRNLSELEETEIPIIPIKIKPCINNAIDFVKANFRENTIHVEITAQNIDVEVMANDLLLDVFENILINAVRYNKRPSVSIWIHICEIEEIESNEYIQLEFKDNGIGISDERKEIIFQEGHHESKGNKGMGLGLSLVIKIINLFHGKISVKDRVLGDYTQGSNFIVLIPKAIGYSS